MINEANNLVGIIPKRFLQVLVENREFIKMSAQNYDTRNMKSANALLYLSPQYENSQFMASHHPINEEDEFNNTEHNGRSHSGLADDLISFRGMGQSQFQDDAISMQLSQNLETPQNRIL